MATNDKLKLSIDLTDITQNINEIRKMLGSITNNSVVRIRGNANDVEAIKKQIASIPKDTKVSLSLRSNSVEEANKAKLALAGIPNVTNVAVNVQTGTSIARLGFLGAAITGLMSSLYLFQQGWNVISNSINGAIENEVSIKKLEQAIKSTGNTTGITSTQFQQMAKDLAKLSNYEDDEILSGLTSTLLTFKSIGKDAFIPAQQAVADMAAMFGGDLQTNAIRLGKALNDPDAGVGALSKIGIQFTDEQKKQIENYTKMGELAKAQKLIIDEVNSQVGGQAYANLSPVAAIKKEFKEIGENLATQLLPVIKSMVPIVQQFGSFIGFILKNINLIGVGLAFGLRSLIMFANKKAQYYADQIKAELLLRNFSREEKINQAFRIASNQKILAQKEKEIALEKLRSINDTNDPNGENRMLAAKEHLDASRNYESANEDYKIARRSFVEMSDEINKFPYKLKGVLNVMKEVGAAAVQMFSLYMITSWISKWGELNKEIGKTSGIMSDVRISILSLGDSTMGIFELLYNLKSTYDKLWFKGFDFIFGTNISKKFNTYDEFVANQKAKLMENAMNLEIANENKRNKMELDRLKKVKHNDLLIEDEKILHNQKLKEIDDKYNLYGNKDNQKPVSDRIKNLIALEEKYQTIYDESDKGKLESLKKLYNKEMEMAKGDTDLQLKIQLKYNQDIDAINKQKIQTARSRYDQLKEIENKYVTDKNQLIGINYAKEKLSLDRSFQDGILSKKQYDKAIIALDTNTKKEREKLANELKQNELKFTLAKVDYMISIEKEKVDQILSNEESSYQDKLDSLKVFNSNIINLLEEQRAIELDNTELTNLEIYNINLKYNKLKKDLLTNENKLTEDNLKNIKSLHEKYILDDLALIELKYKKELELAKGNANIIAAIEKKKQEEISALQLKQFEDNNKYLLQFTGGFESAFDSQFDYMIDKTGSFSEGWHVLMKNLKRAAIDTAYDMGKEWLKMETKKLLASKGFSIKKIALSTWEYTTEVALATWSAIKIIAIGAWKFAMTIPKKLASIYTSFVEFFSFLGPFAPLAAAVPMVAVGAGISKFLSKGFRKGGYTGDGDEDEEAGIVHKGEYVIPAKATKGNVSFLNGITQQLMNNARPINSYYSSGVINTNVNNTTLEQKIDALNKNVSNLSNNVSIEVKSADPTTMIRHIANTQNRMRARGENV